MQSDTNHIVIGVATGGVWISRSGGLTWEPVFDDQPVASIGAVAINQSNPDIIWVGTGESNTRNSTSIGGGIFKSIDGGRHWQLMGLPNSERINRIALHPDNPDIAYVAALGTLWSSNTERGLFRTTDGGKTWQEINTDIPKTHFFSILAETEKILIAGNGTFVYSVDSGKTWQQPAFSPPVIYSWLYDVVRISEKTFVTVGREGVIYRGSLEDWVQVRY